MGIDHIDSLAFERNEGRKQERMVRDVREDQEDDNDNDFSPSPAQRHMWGIANY